MKKGANIHGEARALHARLAWVAGIAAILWALTGLLHPIMMWTAPRPAVQAPPYNEASTDGLLAPGPALAAAGVARADLVRLAGVHADRIWIARHGGRIEAVNAVTGAPAEGVLARHAEKLARYYAGGTDAPLASIREVRAFSVEYPAINRYLPVWRVEFADKGRLAVYVDPMTDRLAAVTDARRRVFLSIFQNVHTLNFLAPVEPLRRLAILILVGSALAMSVAGAVMLARRGAAKGARGAHRLIAWAAAPIVAMFAATGLFHLFFAHAPAPVAPVQFEIAHLDAVPSAGRAALLVASADANGAAWRAETAHGAAYYDLAGAAFLLDDAARARAVAGADDRAPVTPVFSYTDEYGFALKRLPVLRVASAQGPVFVDPLEGLVAGEGAAGAGRIEAWTFDRLHKFGLLNGIGKRNRDYVSMIFAATVLASAGFGLALAWKRRRRS